jgi:hypothetical protein
MRPFVPFVSGPRIRFRRVLLAFGIGALTTIPTVGGSVRAQQCDGCLPVFTSAIDVTGLPLLLRAAVPDRETGHLVDAGLPNGLFGPEMTKLFSTPLSAVFDRFWNTPNPNSGISLRDDACNRPDGIVANVKKAVADLGPGFSAYDIVCNLASAGLMLMNRPAVRTTMAYLLTNNVVSFSVTTPFTCNPNHGNPLCPNDPRFSVHFSVELAEDLVMSSRGICDLAASREATVFVPSASIDKENFTASVAGLFAGQGFVAAEVAITNTTRQAPLPLAKGLEELRASPVCDGSVPQLALVNRAFLTTELDVDPPRGIILRATHAGIGTPVINAPDPPVLSPGNAPPSIIAPELLPAKPLVVAGETVQVVGHNYPSNPFAHVSLATTLPVTVDHARSYFDATVTPGSNGNLCLGGATEIEWGPVGGPFAVESLPGNPLGLCQKVFVASNLTPSTAYQFRARDCDAFTCSPRTPVLQRTTAAGTGNIQFEVVVTMDDGPVVGSGSVDERGDFVTDVTIPAGTVPGQHNLLAVSGNFRGTATILVVAPGGPGRMMMIAQDQPGCPPPNNVLDVAIAGGSFKLFGAGFGPGAVGIHLDAADGAILSTPAARADGTLCEVIQSPPEEGEHTIVAVQNGAVLGQLKQVWFGVDCHKNSPQCFGARQRNGHCACVN